MLVDYLKQDQISQERQRDWCMNSSVPRVSELAHEHKRKKWLHNLKCCNFESDIGKCWVTVKSLLNPGEKDDRTAFILNEVTIADRKMCTATLFGNLSSTVWARGRTKDYYVIYDLDTAIFRRNAQSYKTLGSAGLSTLLSLVTQILEANPPPHQIPSTT